MNRGVDETPRPAKTEEVEHGVGEREQGGEVSDNLLVERWQAGDEAAFSALYRRHAGRLSRRMWRVLGREDDVRDVIQLVFLQVHRSIRTYRPPTPFAAWLNGVSFHVVGSYLRAKRRRRWLGLAPREDLEARGAPPTQSPDRATSDRRLSLALYAALERLPVDKRLAFTLSEIEQMNLREISELTGVSPQAVWVRVESARKALRKLLHAHAVDVVGGEP